MATGMHLGFLSHVIQEHEAAFQGPKSPMGSRRARDLSRWGGLRGSHPERRYRSSKNREASDVGETLTGWWGRPPPPGGAGTATGSPTSCRLSPARSGPPWGQSPPMLVPSCVPWVVISWGSQGLAQHMLALKSLLVAVWEITSPSGSRWQTLLCGSQAGPGVWRGGQQATTRAIRQLWSGVGGRRRQERRLSEARKGARREGWAGQ